MNEQEFKIRQSINANEKNTIPTGQSPEDYEEILSYIEKNKPKCIVEYGSGFSTMLIQQKIDELKIIAKETVDIKGVGFYSLGSIRKTLSDTQKKQYLNLFENYFLKSFSSRLSEYTNPEIDVKGKEVLNTNYTIVNSILVATENRPEVKIDWRIYTKNPENPLIRDLIIEGLSLARTQKEEFASILSSNNGDMNALFKTLEEFSKN